MTPAANPYPGLRPFRESEAHLFFGRSAHIGEVLAELGSSRLVAVMGASASGKSSLVYAGVLPALRGGVGPRAGSHWRIAPFRPGVSPIHNLALALAVPDVLGGDGTDPLMAAAPLEATLRRSAFGLADAVQQSPDEDDGRVLVVVDQFEELFRFDGTVDPAFDGDAEAFVQLLVEAARAGEAPVDVILTMRSDFLGDCARFRELPEAINHGLYLVPRLTRSQLQEAITAPAAASGATLSSRLVQRVLNDAGSDPDMLPVVQHAMMRTWEIWAARGAGAEPIDLEDFEACGGLSEALSRHADEAFFELEGSRRRTIAELTFKRITELGDDHREVRRPTPLAELAAVTGASPEAVEECIGHFAGQGRSFVTVSPDGVVDISHESLIRQWPRLKAWVSEEAESREVYRRLADAADRWGRGEAALLRDPDLQIASQWWKDTQPNQAWAGRYDPAFEPAARYLDRSRKAARRRRVGVVAGMAALAILAVVAVLLALSADHQRNQADRQKRIAIARQLAAASHQDGAAARPVSILAAVQAVRATGRDGARLPAAEEALRTAMQAPEGVKLPSGPASPAHPVSTAFSGDGTVLATGGSDGQVRLWDVAAPDEEPRVLRSDGPPITALDMSTDGRWLAAGSEEGGATLWDLASPDQRHWPLSGHQSMITALAFSPDGRRLASGSLDNTALLWDVDHPDAPPESLPGHAGVVHGLAFSRDGTAIATVGGDGVAYVSEVASPTAEPIELSDGDSGMVAVAFSPDGQQLATGSDDGNARLWDLTRRGEPMRLRHDGRVDAVAYSADGHWLATGSEDRSARLWDLQDRDGPLKRPMLLAHDGAVEAVAFSSSGHQLATGSRDSTARVYDVDHLLLPPVVLGGHEGPVASAIFGGDDRWLATGSNDGTARLWDLEHPSVEPVELSHTADGSLVPVTALDFSPDQPRLVTGADDNSVWVWDLDDRTSAPTVLRDTAVEGFEDAGTTAVALSPDGRRLASGSSDRVVRMWDAGDLSAPPRRLPQLGAGITSLAYSPDGSRMAVGDKDGTAFVVDATDPSAALEPLHGHGDEVTSVAFSGDGRWLATGSQDRTVRLWVASDLSAEPVVLPTGGQVSDVAFTADGRRLAVGVDTTVELWDVDGGRSGPTDVLDAGGKVTSVAYSPDGDTLLVGAGTALKLWDLGVRDPGRSDTNPTVLHGHDATVNAVAYSRDGTRFASAGQDGKALVWRSLASLLDAGCRSVGRNLTQEEWHELLPGEDYQRTCAQWPYGP